MRYLITFSYDGSKFKGYQKQPRLKTVQGEIEKALKELNKEPVSIHASGRTDAGVHAFNQKAHFDLDVDITPEKLQKALNSLVNDYIYIGEYNPIEKDYIYQYNKKLDLVEMERALKYLEGTHDFKSFSKADEEKEDFTRTIIQTNLIRNIKNVNRFIISFLGTGFLRYQVRNMVGLLIEIGEGKRKSEDVLDILEAKDRRKAGITAPPEGLYLKDVFYR